MSIGQTDTLLKNWEVGYHDHHDGLGEFYYNVHTRETTLIKPLDVLALGRAREKVSAGFPLNALVRICEYSCSETRLRLASTGHRLCSMVPAFPCSTERLIPLEPDYSLDYAPCGQMTRIVCDGCKLARCPFHCFKRGADYIIFHRCGATSKYCNNFRNYPERKLGCGNLFCWECLEGRVSAVDELGCEDKECGLCGAVYCSSCLKKNSACLDEGLGH